MLAKVSHNLSWISDAYRQVLSSIAHPQSDEKILLSHFGNINQPKIESLLVLIENAVLESDDKRQTMKRLCVLAVEMLQNIAIHAAMDGKGHMNAYLTITRNNGNYKIYTGSLIIDTDIPQLNQKLLSLNDLEENELRRLYIETLCNDQFSNKGGAGLGLLTIAIKSGNKLHFQLNPLQDHLGYFQMEVTMPIEV